jgi:two-component system nitrate/nitrite response regulator NarL
MGRHPRSAPPSRYNGADAWCVNGVRMPDSAPALPISVLLIDDHALFRSGVRALLQRHTQVAIVGEAADGDAGVACAQALRPDVILLDLHMPGTAGVQALQLLRCASPDSAILMLTVSEQAQDLAQALRAGACGYLVKSIDADYLLRAIVRAAAGEVVVAESMTDKLVAHASGAHTAPDIACLTAREREILGWLARGASNKLIARQLVLAESTVKIHVQNVLKKLKLSSRVQAAVFAVEQRLSSTPP